jgi:gamma-tubulin complex component 2
LADDELKMPVSDITSSRLEALLEISIRTSAADKDPYKDDLKVVLSDKDLITQLMSVISIESSEEETLKRLNPKDLDLSGLEALSFDYVVKWPLSLIISRKKIVHYQLLFRFLFYTKHIERIVNNVWLTSTQLTKQYGCHTLYYKAAILRNKMLNFVLNLQTYVTNEVIEPNWHTLMTTLKNVQMFDEVLNAHDQFLETCLRECHLSNKAIFKLIHKLMAKVTIYVNFMNGVHRQMELRSANSMSMEMKMEYLATIFTPKFDAQINSMDRDFNKEILHLVEMLREVSKRQKSDSVLNLVLKLDFVFERFDWLG